MTTASRHRRSSWVGCRKVRSAEVRGFATKLAQQRRGTAERYQPPKMSFTRSSPSPNPAPRPKPVARFPMNPPPMVG